MKHPEERKRAETGLAAVLQQRPRKLVGLIFFRFTRFLTSKIVEQMIASETKCYMSMFMVRGSVFFCVFSTAMMFVAVTPTLGQAFNATLMNAANSYRTLGCLAHMAKRN